LPLPVFSSIHIADAINKEGEEFDVLLGLDKKYTEQLKNLSLDKSDTDLQNNTGDFNRFGIGSYENWYKKNRTIFALINKQKDALAAIIWFGPKSLGKKSIKFGEEGNDESQAEWHTISLRSYSIWRGKKMMKNFAEFTLNFYKKYFAGVKFWMGTDDRNVAIIKIFSSLNFIVDEENSDLTENWLVMTQV
jgi:hypothetical protein